MPNWLTGILTCLLVLINTLIGIGPMLLLGIIKALIPHPWVRRETSRAIMWIANTWAELNKSIFALLTPTRWDIRCDIPLYRDHSYLVICNHQSWVDIPALVQALNYKVPYYKFFLKKELIWVPFLGLAFWALDYPFMKRYSKAHLEKHPEDKGKDLDITRRACEKFHGIPVTVVNYLEGTRFTPAKQAAQASPYRYLLKPKSGGMAFAMAALGEQMKSLLDVTIVYPGNQPPGFWQWVSGQVSEVIVDIRGRDVPLELFHGDYANDPAFRQQFQAWVQVLWQTKDERIASLRQELS
ncbi:acyltransferase [Halopseudomonas salegens]|uniref:1-acyl-sn-glycerol-3-phosphate acyltransferase n=1 Tax=Halopseudomonas salegens TaxID=1434072 RepID=A0A1H2DYN1_9GAMM|nr:acyltransferase [Halopseudomonas salegens]SDT87889.1 1-acyl-sn-glycerol-3-phosphate acyltransferase [Halopseudomonas salegens]